MMNQPKKPQGSILIWTVLLGVSLSAVFFFFAQRLNFNAAVQRKSITHQNTTKFIESYADYLESLTDAELETLIIEPNFQNELQIINDQLDNEVVSGSLSNSTSSINGKVPPNNSIVNHEIQGGDALLEWNLCNLEDDRELSISLVMSDEEFDLCESNIYQNRGVLSGDPIELELETTNTPVSYRITPYPPEAETSFTSDQWILDLQIEFSPRKRVRIRRRW